MMHYINIHNKERILRKKNHIALISYSLSYFHIVGKKELEERKSIIFNLKIHHICWFYIFVYILYLYIHVLKYSSGLRHLGWSVYLKKT